MAQTPLDQAYRRSAERTSAWMNARFAGAFRIPPPINDNLQFEGCA